MLGSRLDLNLMFDQEMPQVNQKKNDYQCENITLFFFDGSYDLLDCDVAIVLGLMVS
jgi:hypothetical protein